LQPKDYYKILGVSKDTPTEEIRKTYRKLAKKYHPDTNPNDKPAEEKFKEVQEAYDVLGDATKKQQYDQMREGGFAGFGPGGARPGGGAQHFRFEDLSGFGDVGDLFSSIFGGGPGAGGPRARGGGYYGPMKGEDVHAEIEIPFEQAISGGKTSFKINTEEECSDCGGNGMDTASDAKTCPSCQGRGNVATSQGGFSISRPCPSCLGRGVVGGKACGKCGGKGSTIRTRSIAVKIPAGVETGSKIRIGGQGQKGVHGGPPGDIILMVRVREHIGFKREGSSIYSELTLNLAQAVLGTTAKVETIDGLVNLRIPAGTQPGKKLRLKGKGVKEMRGDGRGDHIVQVKVEIPESLSDVEKEEFVKFADNAKLTY
jgi:molecular chaperone DnaJ